MKHVVMAGVLVVVALIGFSVWRAFQPTEAEKETAQREAEQALTGGAATEVVKGACDGYEGYAGFSSRRFDVNANRQGVTLQLTLDNGDYKTRFKGLASGDFDFALMPVDRFVKFSGDYGDPGMIVAVIAESIGADTVKGKKSLFKQGDIMALNDSARRVVLQPGTPNEFLMDLIIHRLSMRNLASSQNWIVAANSPEEVLRKAVAGEGDAFVLYEPFASQASAQADLIDFLTSADFRGYIIDVVVGSKKTLKENPSKIERTLAAYFLTMDEYHRDRSALVREIAEKNGESESTVSERLAKIDFFDLADNCGLYFNIPPIPGAPSQEGLIQCIQRCADVLAARGRISAAARQAFANPFNFRHPNIVARLKDQMPSLVSAQRDVAITFAPLSDDAWEELVTAGGIPLNVQPIMFLPNSSTLTEEATAALAEVGDMLKATFQSYYVVIEGHVGNSTTQLSQERADTVKQWLVENFQIDPNRLHAIGMGSTVGPARYPDENDREWLARRARVEFKLHKYNAL